MNILDRKKEDPVTQPVVTVGADGQKVRLTPFKVEKTEGDFVEGFGGVPQNAATLPKPRFQIKGVITIR